MTIIEQLKLLRGDVSPTDITYDDLVQQAAISFGSTFLDSIKDIDRVENKHAFKYVSKMYEIITYVIRKPDTQLKVLARALITLYSGTYNSVSNATDAQWEDFVVSNMKQTMEHTAGVFPHEKEEYDSI